MHIKELIYISKLSKSFIFIIIIIFHDDKASFSISENFHHYIIQSTSSHIYPSTTLQAQPLIRNTETDFIIIFEFVLFAFYILIISHHICCFSVHLIAKLFTQSLVFNVSEFLLIYSSIFTSKQLKNINITTLTH